MNLGLTGAMSSFYAGKDKNTKLATTMAKKFPGPSNTTQTTPNTMKSTLDTLNTSVNSTPFQFKAPEQFQYNPNTDQAFQSYMAQAKRQLGDNQANTNARLRATGQGKSSYSETVANQLANRASMDMQDQMINQYMPQAYQQYNDTANRNLDVQKSNYGVGQDRINNLATLFANQYQSEVTKPLAESQATGYYMPGQAQSIYDDLTNLKATTEQNWSSMNNEQRQTARLQGDALRAQLGGMGIDTSNIEANDTANVARDNRGTAGTRTIAGQTLDQNILDSNRNYDRGVLESDRSFARDALESDRNYNFDVDSWTKEFNEKAKQNGIQNAIEWANNSVSQQNANRLSAQASSSGGESSSGGSNDYYQATSSDMNTLYDTLLSQFSQYDDNTKKNILTKDTGQLRSLVNSILDFELPDDQTANMLRRFGISQKKAEELLNSSSSNSSNNLPSYEQIMRETLGL